MLKVKVPLICLATQCVSLRSEGRYIPLSDWRNLPNARNTRTAEHTLHQPIGEILDFAYGNAPHKIAGTLNRTFDKIYTLRNKGHQDKSPQCFIYTVQRNEPFPHTVAHPNIFLPNDRICVLCARTLRDLPADGVLGVPARIPPALGRHSLVVMCAQVQASLGPRIEVVLGRNGSASRTLLLAHGDVLPEGAGALDRGLVDLLVLPNLVGGAVGSQGADLLALGGAVAVAVFLDVVFDERVGGPAVDGDEDGARGGGCGAGEGDVSAQR